MKQTAWAVAAPLDATGTLSQKPSRSPQLVALLTFSCAF